jgi:broad specificity phosphatase PhoE
LDKLIGVFLHLGAHLVTTPMILIYLIRHAQGSLGKGNYDRLSDLGIRQAKILGDSFAHLGMRFDAVYSGSLERQTDTARIVMSRLPEWDAKPDLTIVPQFNEFDAAAIIISQATGMIREDPSMAENIDRIYTHQRSLQMVLEKAVGRWISGRHDIAGIETWQEFRNRISDGLTLVKQENTGEKTVAVFTSGGVASAILQMTLGLSNEETLRLAWQIRNTSVTTLKCKDDRLGLLSFNCLTHLEWQNRPELLTYR